MEHIFPPKTVNLVANSLVTITWGASDFGPRFNESIIKKTVSARFTCTSTAVNSVYCGVRYSTLTKTYLVAERKTLFYIPPNGSVEVSPASKPIIGLFNQDIVSISLDITSPVTGNVTVTLTLDDEPPPITSDPGSLIGLDAQFATDAIIISTNATQVLAALTGTQTTTLYTCPSGKRFIIDLLDISIDPTPSYPGDIISTPGVNITGIGTTININLYSLTTDYRFIQFNEAKGITLTAGGFVQVSSLNFSATQRNVEIALFGREVF